jgi:hypothetical protein
MRVFLIHHTVVINMKKAMILPSIIIVLFSNLSNAQDVPLYSFMAKVSNRQDTYIHFTYKNTSQSTQCIRVEDLDVNMKLVADALYVTSAKGESIKYTGVQELSLSITPQKFIILPAGQEVGAGIHLDKYYDTKKENVIVSYSIPVIPCKVVLEKYIKIPFPDFMRHKIKDPTTEKTDIYAADYPEWSKYGFIAVSKPLLIEISKK